MEKSVNVGVPEGVILTPLKPITDCRGTLCEAFRLDRVPEKKFVQWNLVRSNVGTLRGVHVHKNRADYLVVIEGEMLLGLYDMRRNSPTFQQSTIVSITPETHKAAYIPTGVAHGFYFTQPSLTMYGLTEYWSMADEMGCHPFDADLKLNWPDTGSVQLSDRDQAAGTLAVMQAEYDEWVNTHG
ncbi:dTDP-4-dehydrorhamnose 3,5-epimerase family protein [Kordiimonas laminariae]|uniref:dTDP-4-dehydrorhamnose 3,5-epimerase family protein n=1 Tax=Kordiimonas laminariae TaxID=2917717 RepID=UPI001FF4E597|nr:dTDP-4-dehydrorhamnose 3,5-epimerase [Kordiimonas laminariae]MCK0069515.1 dTDP-4-dehydrorhamnose 3,5-epimerase [Kordiimonas laminariae]